MKKRIKIALFVFFGLILFIPFIFTFVNMNSKIGLKGDVVLAEKPKLNGAGWMKEEFQPNFEKYINDNIGFRPVFVRLRNQLLYSLFGEAKAIGVIEGKEKYFYERNYIKAYNGEDFIGIDSIQQNIQRIKILQDSLETRGKTLIVCLAPGKGSFYPEYFPDQFVQAKTDSTNYHFYAKLLAETGINHLDFNRWFLQMKDTSKYILYPKYGIHWSYYGMLLATDSLIHYVKKLRNEDLPDLKIGKFHLSTKLDRMDYDIADGMNLLWQLPSEPMCYPENEWESADGKTQPKTILIGDSFYWSMFQLGLWAKSFSPGGFWFYNRQIYPESFEKPLKVEDVDYWKYISENDLFILLVTEANLPKFPWGFVENSLDAFQTNDELWAPGKPTKKEREAIELQTHITNIRANENWMKDIEQKALKMNISVDSMLILDARWMMEYKKSQKK